MKLSKNDEKFSMRRFFLAGNAVNGDQAVITGDEARHLMRVLRLKPGCRVELFDGRGTVFRAVINALSAEGVSFSLLERCCEDHGDAARIILGLGMLKGKKMDLVIQKATELGVHAVFPVETSFCEKRRNQRLPLSRWQRIVIEACKQCRRSVLMEISPLVDFSDFIGLSFNKKLLFAEQERKKTLADIDFTGSETVALLVGPEGGFSEKEVTAAGRAGFCSVSLGENILRAETAALTAIAVTRFLLGR